MRPHLIDSSLQQRLLMGVEATVNGLSRFAVAEGPRDRVLVNAAAQLLVCLVALSILPLEVLAQEPPPPSKLFRRQYNNPDPIQVMTAPPRRAARTSYKRSTRPMELSSGAGS